MSHRADDRYERTQIKLVSSAKSISHRKIRGEDGTQAPFKVDRIQGSRSNSNNQLVRLGRRDGEVSQPENFLRAVLFVRPGLLHPQFYGLAQKTKRLSPRRIIYGLHSLIEREREREENIKN